MNETQFVVTYYGGELIFVDPVATKMSYDNSMIYFSTDDGAKVGMAPIDNVLFIQKVAINDAA